VQVIAKFFTFCFGKKNVLCPGLLVKISTEKKMLIFSAPLHGIGATVQGDFTENWIQFT
jgi:hypothetical protein